MFKLVFLYFALSVLTGCHYFSKNDIPPEINGWDLEMDLVPNPHWTVEDIGKLPLSSGDRVRVLIDEDKAFSGVFEINIDGNLLIPYLNTVPVAGKSVYEAEKMLLNTLIEQKMYQADFNALSIQILQWSKIIVYVKGAVFSPGRILINDKLAAQQSFQQTQQSGDNSIQRFLSYALKGAGGIRPDADLTQIKIVRNHRIISLDVSGILKGNDMLDIPLISGDQVLVPSKGKIDPLLIRPSLITPPGFQVFMSNLTQPGLTNASSAISKSSRSVPYGTRLLHASMAANCIGGSWVNSSRKVLHSTKNLLTKEATSKLYDLDTVMERANHIEDNPYLMPDDGIACFDSDATNIREVARYLSDILDPLKLLMML